MSEYGVGDSVLVLAKVVEVHGADVGYSVELFSKTDQYTAMVRTDLIIAKVDPPPQEEPDRDCIARDSRGDLWRWSPRQAAWECVTKPSLYRSWLSLADFNDGPLRIYGQTA